EEKEEVGSIVNKEIDGKGSSAADVEQRDEKEIIEAEIVNVDRSPSPDRFKRSLEAAREARSPLAAASRERSAARGCSRSRTLREAFNWLIDGPWKVEGKLDPNFRDWLAKDWLSRYGGTIHQKRADVLAHFKKDPENLAIRWEQYSSEYLDRYKNTQTRLKNGIAIDDLEQEQLKENVAAVSKPLPAELSPVAKKQPSPVVGGDGIIDNKKIGMIQEAALVISVEASTQQSLQINGSKDKESDRYLVDFESIPSAEEKPDNPQAYKIWQPKEVEVADPQKVKELMRSFLSKFGGSDRAREPINEDGSKLEKLNNWLCDEILYPVAIERAKVAGYEIEYSENGKAIRIKEPEF
nr:hypothetical protein [Prochloraceae cyanobacterium]